METFLTFSVDRENFALRITSIKEVLDKFSITRVPNACQYIDGVLNLRGSVIPVVNLRRKLSLPPASSDGLGCSGKGCVVVTEIRGENGSNVLGLKTDTVHEVIDVAEESIFEKPNVGNAERIDNVESIIKHDEEILIVLDLAGLFEDYDFSRNNGAVREKQQCVT